MLVITARNVNDALYKALKSLAVSGFRRSSRNGEVILFPFPVTTVYSLPMERCLWNDQRDANPFFHFFESLWMLSGRGDVKFVSQFSKNITRFSDDGKTFHGAYGPRWRSWFGHDQLNIIVKRLKANPDDRRCVLQMWDGSAKDLGSSSADVPCNTAVYISINVNGCLDITVTNRSNDLVWGAYGANAVQMSMLQEYLAGRIGVPVGTYWQVSNNLHMYDFNKHQIMEVIPDAESDGASDPYCALVKPYPLFGNEDPETWDQDLSMFMEDPTCYGYRHQFFSRVAKPLWFSYQAFKNKDDSNRYRNAKLILEQCVASDWQLAAYQWLDRRELKASAKKEAENAKQ